jgi:hypothetical protein
LAVFAHEAARHERIDSRAGAQVEHGFARLDARMLPGKSAAEPEIGVRDIALYRLVGVSDHVEAAGVGRAPARATAAARLFARKRPVLFPHKRVNVVRLLSHVLLLV